MSKVKSKPFSRLSAASKRIAIAEDILKQIKLERYSIEQGTWLIIDPIESSDEQSQQNKAKLVQNALLGGKHTVVIDSAPATCTCCAVGAACASAIRLFNQDTIEGSPENGYELHRYEDGMAILEKYFPQAQVDLIEAAFEIREDDHHETATEQKLSDAVLFGDEHDDDTERLQAICKNIIKNNGTFKP